MSKSDFKYIKDVSDKFCNSSVFFIGLKPQVSLILEIIFYKDMVYLQTTFHRQLQKPFCCLPIEFTLNAKSLGGPQFGLSAHQQESSIVIETC